MIARQAELRREIREHDWKADSLGEAAAQAGLAEVGEANGQTLVGIVAQRGQMAAVVVRRGSARLIRLGDAAAAAEAARRLNADLDTLAGRRLPARLETVIKESIRHQAGTLTAEVIVPLRSWLGDDDAVGTMTAYHRLLAAGIRPAEALARATAAERFSPFVCFGGG